MPSRLGKKDEGQSSARLSWFGRVAAKTRAGCRCNGPVGRARFRLAVAVGDKYAVTFPSRQVPFNERQGGKECSTN